MPIPYKKLGIIREGKVPADHRVPLTPDQCRDILRNHPSIDLVVQRSPVRAFSDAEYEAAGVPLVDDLEDRDLILGIKEVPVDMLIPGTSYLFFSHTIKKQPHNRKLIRAVIDKGITLMDHELLTNERGERVLAFGYWAGVVGAYNGIRGWHVMQNGADLKPAHACHDMQEMIGELRSHPLPGDLRVVVSGAGRVGRGAMEVLDRAGLRRVAPQELLHDTELGGVYAVLGTEDLYERSDGQPFDKAAFHADPSGHRATFRPYAERAHIYMACHYWDPRGPKILTREDLADPASTISVVADISCDIDGPIDSTLRASTIAEPFYGYDPETGNEVAPGAKGSILVMAVDNLPCELPRDASRSFGADLVSSVLPALLGNADGGMIERATIVKEGRLTERFKHLSEYAGVV